MSVSVVHGVTRTELGWAGVAVSAQGITRATLFAPERDAILAELSAYGSAAGASELLDGALARLAAYAGGETAAIEDVPVDLRLGTKLDHEIWLRLRTIPRGETRTYSWLAGRVGLAPTGARAVGAALARNPVPIWLPCHRVVGRDGTLRGFAGGLDMKRRLLVLEGALPAPLAGRPPVSPVGL